MNWWETTKENTNSVCSEEFRTFSGANVSLSLMQNFASVKHNIGWGTEVSVIFGAGNLAEKGTAISWVGTAWCGGALIGGGLDAWWQVNHEGKHFGTSVLDFITEIPHNIHTFLHNEYEWWMAKD